MRVLCLYQHYATPDAPANARLYAMLNALAGRHEVDVVTSRQLMDRRPPPAERRFPDAPAGVRLHYVDAPYENAMGARARLASYGRFAWGALRTARRLPRPDVVYGISTPLSTAAAAAAAARHHRRPWVFEVRDLWPDFPVQMGAVPRLAHRPLYRLERALYRSAARVISVSPDMAAHVEAAAPGKGALHWQGTDPDLFALTTDADAHALRERLGLGTRRVALYAGSLGRANAVDALVGAAERLQHRDDLAVVVLGAGYGREAVRAAAERLPNLVYAGQEPRWRALAYLRLADLALVPFLDKPVLAANAPGKLFDALWAGVPAVVTNPGWTRRLVEEYGCGWYAPPTPEALADAVERAFADPDGLAAAGRHAAAFARPAFDRRRLAAALEATWAAAAGVTLPDAPAPFPSPGDGATGAPPLQPRAAGRRGTGPDGGGA